MLQQRFPCCDRDNHDKRSGIVTFRLRLGLVRLRDFRSRQKTVVSRQDFMGLCYDKVFSIMTEFSQDKRVSCHDKVFCVATGYDQDQGALCCDKAICVVIEFGRGQGILCRDRIS